MYGTFEEDLRRFSRVSFLVLNGCSFKAKEVSTGGEFAVHFEAGASYVMSLHDGMVRFFDKRYVC